MSPFNANFDGVEEGEEMKPRKPIPEGYYTLVISETEEQISKNDNDMVKVTYTVVLGMYQGRKIYEHIVFSPGIMGRTMHFLHVIGEPYQGDIKIFPENWIGSKLVAKVEKEDYTNKKGEEVEQNKVRTHEVCSPEPAPEPEPAPAPQTFKDSKLPF